MYEALIGPRIFRRGEYFVADFASDPDLVRRALLFYEHTHFYRGSGVTYGLTQDEQFLVDNGFASEAKGKSGFAESGFFSMSTDSTEMLLGNDKSGGIIDAFRKDGSQLIEQGAGSIHPLYVREPLQFEGGREHISVELVRSVTLPSRDVPLNELADFRRENVDGLRRYWTFVDELSSAFSAHDNREVAVKQALGKFADALQENHSALEQHFKNRLTVATASIVLVPIVVGAANISLDAFPALGDFKYPLAMLAGGSELALANMPYAGPSATNPAVGYVQKIENL